MHFANKQMFYKQGYNSKSIFRPRFSQ